MYYYCEKFIKEAYRHGVSELGWRMRAGTGV